MQRNLQQQSSIFVDYYYRERNMASELEQRTDKIINDIKTIEDKKYEVRKQQEDERKKHKKQVSKIYET